MDRLIFLHQFYNISPPLNIFEVFFFFKSAIQISLHFQIKRQTVLIKNLPKNLFQGHFGLVVCRSHTCALWFVSLSVWQRGICSRSSNLWPENTLRLQDPSSGWVSWSLPLGSTVTWVSPEIAGEKEWVKGRARAPGLRSECRCFSGRRPGVTRLQASRCRKRKKEDFLSKASIWKQPKNKWQVGSWWGEGEKKTSCPEAFFFFFFFFFLCSPASYVVCQRRRRSGSAEHLAADEGALFIKGGAQRHA